MLKNKNVSIDQINYLKSEIKEKEMKILTIENENNNL